MSQIRWLVDRFHAHTPEREVAEDIQRRTKQWDALTNVQRADILHEALDRHRENGALYTLAQSPMPPKARPADLKKRLRVKGNQKLPQPLNARLGYRRTPVGTARVEPDGYSLFAGERQLSTFAKQFGVIFIDTKAVWAELDNAGRLRYAYPNDGKALRKWIDAVLAEGRQYPLEEKFVRGYPAGPPSMNEPRVAKALKKKPRRPSSGTVRPPRPGTVRFLLLKILQEADGQWLTITEIMRRARRRRTLVRWTVYTTLWEEVKRGEVNKELVNRVGRYRFARGSSSPAERP